MTAQRALAVGMTLLVLTATGWRRGADRSEHRPPEVVEPGTAPVVRAVLLAESTLSRKYGLRVAHGRAPELEFFLREPRKLTRPVPAVFILAGIETGREALDLIDERDDALLLSMNYPIRAPEGLTWASPFRALPAARRLATETLRGGRFALDYLSGRRDVDQDRIILLGVSFGGFFMTALAAGDPRPDVVVLIYGGGDLPYLARHNLRQRPWWVPDWLLGLLARTVFGDLEPLRHAERFALRYFLMVNSRRDEMFPATSALALFNRARLPKKLIWYETGHMNLFDRALIRDLTREVVAELRAAGVLAGGPAPRQVGHGGLATE